MTIPTLEEHQKAKKIVHAYEVEQYRLKNNRLEAFEEDLKEYFMLNNIGGYTIKQFELRKNCTDRYEIIPIDPCLEECYEGDNDEDIEKLSEKHNIEAFFVYWMYHK